MLKRRRQQPGNLLVAGLETAINCRYGEKVTEVAGNPADVVIHITIKRAASLPLFRIINHMYAETLTYVRLYQQPACG
jgi:hypothetical protein